MEVDGKRSDGSWEEKKEGGNSNNVNGSLVGGWHLPQMI